jgi:uncharacterized protein (TIGR03086 family)
MTEISDRYRRLSDQFSKRLAAVPPDGWNSPTPCEEWNARQVVQHVVDSQGMFLGFVGRQLGDIPSADDDPKAAFDAARDQVLADLEDPERAQEEFEGFFGRSTFEAAVDRFLSFDLVVHGWDLARATGQDEHIDEADVRRVREDSAKFGDAIRSPGAMGPEVEPPPGADEQTKMLAYLGRRV